MRWLVGIALALAGCAVEEDASSPAAAVEPVSVVELVAVARGDVVDAITASAVVESERQADLTPEAVGVVRSVEADEGDVVEAGQVLAVLDNVSLGAGAERASAEVRRLEVQAAGTRDLFARGAISERELREAEFALETARLSLREARAGFGTTRIVAPFDGVVGLRSARVGELGSSAKVMFQVVDLDALRVVASFPERELGRVSPGQLVTLRSAYDAEQSAAGEVSRVSPVVDANTGTFRVTVAVHPGARTLRPGQFVSVSVEVGRHADVLVVPKSAVVYENGLPVLYVAADPPPKEAGAAELEAAPASGGWWPFGADEDDVAAAEPEEAADTAPARVAARRVVTLGLTDERFAEVLEGVALGDEVVSVGQHHLRDGAKIRPAAPAPEGEG